MVRSWTYFAIILVISFNVVTNRTISIPLKRFPRSPPAPPSTESHISNFLHNHRADSRADKPGDHPGNSTNNPAVHKPAHPPVHHPTTAVPPISQTELLVNLIHNTITTVRDQFPAIIGAISSPKDPPTTTTTKHPRRAHHGRHKTHSEHGEHSAHERSANLTSEEEPTKSEEEPTKSGESEDGDEGSGSGDEDDNDEEEEDFDNVEVDAVTNNAPPLLPPELVRTIVEASASSAARGAAGASAGTIASLSAGSSAGGSGGSGRSARQSDEENHGSHGDHGGHGDHGDHGDHGGGGGGSGSGEFLIATIGTKARALVSLLFAPLISAYTLLNRNTGSSFGSSSGLFPEENKHGHHHSNDHHSHHHSNDHHHDDHHSGGEHHQGHHDNRGHHAEGHGHHGHHSTDHDSHSTQHHHQPEHHHEHHADNSSSDIAANLISGSDDDRESRHRLSFRNAFFKYAKLNQTEIQQGAMNQSRVSYRINETLANGPVRIVFDNGGLDYDNGGDNETDTIVRNSRKSRSVFNEGFGIYLLEILGSIAGLTWGAFNQIQILFRGRSDDSREMEFF